MLFRSLVWYKGQELRKQLCLQPKQFHITLSQIDAHDVDKGIASLLTPFPSDPSVGLLENVSSTLYIFGLYAQAELFAIQLCHAAPTSPKGFLHLGNIALKLGKFKLAMLAFSCAFSRSTPDNAKAKGTLVRRIRACIDETEVGTVLTEDEVTQIGRAHV